MVQGNTKGLKQKTISARSTQTKAQPKKGRRAIPPKKAAAVKHAAIHNTLSAKINRSVETQMVTTASSGKLTILKQDKPVPTSSKK